MLLPESFLSRARHWRAYGLWRAMREGQQLRRFDRQLAEVAAGGEPYCEGDTIAKLRSHAGSRRRIDPGRRLSIAAFGARDWEDMGLWQAFERASDFSLFEYPAARRSGLASESRSALGREFLAHIDRYEQSGGRVTLAFLYASGEHVDPEMLAELTRRGIWSVLMSLDDKQQLFGVRTGDLREWQIEVARAADLYWTTWRAGADWLVSKAVNPWYAPEAADPEIFSPGDEKRDIDVLWLGRGYGRRVDLVRYLRSRGFDVHARGPGWPGGSVPFPEMIGLYRRSKVALGMGGVGQTDRIKHLKGRDFEVPMTGALYLTSFNPELADHFAIGSEILCYSSFEECAEVLSWILRRPRDAEQIRRSGRARAVADHTWDRRIARMLSLHGLQP